MPSICLRNSRLLNRVNSRRIRDVADRGPRVVVGNGFAAGTFFSGVVITDGQWHRVGFVWDGITRALYVDEQEVIRDGHPQLASSDKGLVIGGGALSLPGTYFGGMIDDVPIYNRVVRP